MSNSLVVRFRQIRNINEESERTNVIVKVGNKWRIKGRKVKWWPAEYDTKSDAEAALRAYWANKCECVKRSHKSITLEGFTSESGRSLLRNIQQFLSKLFGHSLYFDHDTDRSVDLFYRGRPIAELLYDDKSDEVTVVPERSNAKPTTFYDASEYKIQDYLSDLILGNV